MQYKICKTCLEEKEISCFHKNRDSHLSICKMCRSAKRTGEYADDPILRENTAKKQKTYSDNNRDKVRKSNNKAYLKHLEIRLANAKDYYDVNRESILAYNKANREAISAAGANYRLVNRSKIAATNKVWRKNNKHKLAQNQMKRVAAEKQACPLWAEDEWDKFLVEETYHLSKIRTAVIGIKHNVDHIVPLTSDKVCGLHCASNLRVMERLANISKGNRHWPDMW